MHGIFLGSKILIKINTLIIFRYCEESLIEAVSTIIWVSPRLHADVQELAVVCNLPPRVVIEKHFVFF